MQPEYKIALPSFYWEEVDRNPKLFKSFVKSYLAKNHSNLKPVRITKGKYIACIKKECE
jgi:hypothetical protein